MVSHVVLFRLRTDLGQADRRGFVEALETALRDIPSVRGFRFGRRVTVGAAYEQAAPALDFIAVIDFDDAAGLQAYLTHPAHAALGARFNASIDEGLVFDYDMQGQEGLRGLLRRPHTM